MSRLCSWTDAISHMDVWLKAYGRWGDANPSQMRVCGHLHSDVYVYMSLFILNLCVLSLCVLSSTLTSSILGEDNLISSRWFWLSFVSKLRCKNVSSLQLPHSQWLVSRDFDWLRHSGCILLCGFDFSPLISRQVLRNQRRLSGTCWRREDWVELLRLYLFCSGD